MFELNKNIKKAFTLSEVLITLVIIGIIAAITVPTIIANSNEKALKVALKKNHSVLEQALRRYYIDNGEYFSEETFSSLKIKNEFFSKYFNVGCMGSQCKYTNDIEYKTYDGRKAADGIRYGTGFDLMLDDGTFIYFGAGNTKYECIYLFIDVNGPYKKPNRIGKDTFVYQMFYKSGEVVPGGSKASNFPEETYCNSSKSNTTQNGFGCTAKALRDTN